MISWKSIYAQDEDGNETGVFRTEYTDTPLLSGYSLQEIECMAQKGRVPCDLYNLPCHNQKVERAIKLVSETSKRTTSRLERDGIIRNVLASREELPKFETKNNLL